MKRALIVLALSRLPVVFDPDPATNFAEVHHEAHPATPLADLSDPPDAAEL
jgi:hypothetical protein